jgi:hypothetical protein
MSSGTSDRAELYDQYVRRFSLACCHASKFGFVMPYTRDNLHGFIYEPWHWVLEEIADVQSGHHSCE